MKTIYYAGFRGAACRAYYEVVSRDDGHVDVVVINSSRLEQSTTLWNCTTVMSGVLNRILVQELPGIALEYVRFYSLVDTGDGRVHSAEIPIRVVPDGPLTDGVLRPASGWRRLMPGLRSGRWLWSHDERVGRVDLRADFENKRSVSDDDARALCGDVGYEPVAKPPLSPALPAMRRLFVVGPTSLQ